MIYWASLSAANIATALTYTSNYYHAGSWITGHLWSLSVEEQFYLLWPLALILFFPARLPIVLSVIASGPLFRYAFWRIWGFQGLEYPFPVVMDALAMGCLLAIVQPQIVRFKRILMSRWFVLVPIATMLMTALDRRRPRTPLIRNPANGRTGISQSCIEIVFNAET